VGRPLRPEVGAAVRLGEAPPATDAAVELRLKSLYYGDFRAVRDTDLTIRRHSVTALIGPSGCGKSTVLRSINRMNDLVRGFRLDGEVRFRGRDVYGKGVDPAAVRRGIGMVFQQPNPFAMSVARNVAFGLRLNGVRGGLDDKVEQALRGAALWDEVKDGLHKSALALSGGQQQRLCIARAIATEPEVVLMDEPCSAIDPVATLKIEELIAALKAKYTIAIVTHNLQQARGPGESTRPEPVATPISCARRASAGCPTRAGLGDSRRRRRSRPDARPPRGGRGRGSRPAGAWGAAR